ncbi:S-locus glycoprotein domain-containing protein [Artemisia annua]|uniref:S-locus glycoprotein domain-containing protein n=1 Tax=Artemisia annua TaxID=35608 RepID=A0A2U1PHI2_ARTAN|nr:S-locus glycoprotein domain-containing protein [Artemisia annua]
MVKGKYPQDYIKKGPVIQARIGPYNGIQFAGLPNFKPDSYYAYKFYMVVNQKEMYFMISFNSTTYFLRSIATPGGKLEIWHMNTQSLQTNFHSKNNKVIRVTLSIISAGLVVLGLILTFYAWSKRKKRPDAETQGKRSSS